MDKNEFLSFYLNRGAASPVKPKLSDAQTLILTAKDLMRAGNFSEALLNWRSLGPELDFVFMLEEMTCLYQLGHFYEWNRKATELRGLVRQGITVTLEPLQAKNRILLLLAKTLEEAGWLNETLEILSELRQDFEFQPVAEAHLLRICLQYRIPSEDLPDLYRSLLSFHLEGRERDWQPKGKFEFDIQQALTLYEATQADSRLAQLRGQKIIERSHLPQNATLILIDLLEIAFEFESDPAALLAECSQLNLNRYEEKLIQMVKTNRIEDPLFLFSQMPTANALRLCALYLRRHKDDILSSLAAQMIRSLGAKNQKLWSEFFACSEEVGQQRISVKDASLVVGGMRIPIPPLLEKVLLVMIQANGQVPTETVIERVWNETPGPSQFERLKTATHRINKLLNERTGLEKAIVFSKADVMFARGVRFEKVS